MFIIMFIVIPCCFDYCSFVLTFGIEKCESSNLFFFKIVLACLGPLTFYMNFRISLPISAKKDKLDFDGDCVESGDHFGEYCRF